MCGVLAVAVACAVGCAVERVPGQHDDHAAPASTERHDEPRRIVGGARSFADPAVVALLSNGEQFCTGTLIEPTTVLTAAHCLPPYNQTDLADVTVFIGDDTSADSVDIAVVDATAHPMWQLDLLGYDVGLLRLERPAPVEPLPVSSLTLEQTDAGAELRLIGYGTTQNGGRDHGVRYSGIAAIAAIDAYSIYASRSPATTCNGDSGGPALLVRDGVEVVVGVHSRSDCTTAAVEERVDIHVRTFIAPYAAAGSSCPPDQGCAPPCVGDGCVVSCERDGACARPPSAYRPGESDAGCRVADSSGTDVGWLALVVAVAAGLRVRRRTSSASA